MEGEVKKTEGETLKKSAWGRNRRNPAVTHQASGAKHKLPSWLLGSSKGEANTSYVDDYESAICASVQTVNLSAHNSLIVVKTKIELDSHADTCVVGDYCLVIHDHKRPVNVFGYNPKAGSKHACKNDTTVAYKHLRQAKLLSS